MGFDAASELDKIRQKRKVSRRKPYAKSKLDKFKFEILKLKSEGASLGDIRFFLHKNRIKVVPSTIQRWLKKHG